MSSLKFTNRLLTTIIGLWVSPVPERVMCAIFHTLFFLVFHLVLKIIDVLTNQPGRRSGSHLESCTTEVRAVRLYNHPVHGDRLVFVDTPGFDNIDKSDLEILQIISNWLQKV
jgi:hypothetical protein